jgi:hypothetical protein
LGGSRAAISVSDTTGASGIDLTYSSTTGVLSGVLANSAITIAGTSTSLGGSITLATITGTSGIVSGSSQVTPLLPAGTISGSSQVDHNATTNYVANRHIDHTEVSITAGAGLNGGGDISTTRTLSVNSGSMLPYYSSSIFSTVAGDITISSTGTATIAANSVALGTDTTGNYMADVSAGTGISVSHTPGEGSTATITNAGVTSNVAGSGISVSGATGAVTITNTGVRSLSAGTGVTLGSTTGDNCSISIGQAVGTGNSPTFAGLTINGSITATGDITAYYSSDKRFKDNIVEIDGALDKVKKIRGVKWTWNDLADDVMKQAPTTGLIAQEVQEVLPEVVKQREDGYLGLDYAKMMGLMVEAIKEQQLQIEKLQIELNNCKNNKGL